MFERAIQGFGRGEFVDQTTLNPMGLAILIICGLILLFVQRRNAIWPIMIIACFIAPAQRIVVFTLDFNMLRVMVLFGLFRIFFKKEHRNFQMMPLDKILIAYVFSKLVIHFIREPTSATLILELGTSFDALGIYFLFRNFIQNWEDLNRAIVAIIVVSIPLAAFFMVEHSSGRNIFSIFGGVPEFTMIRDGRLRCQGAFPHPIIAGCFWAALIPLIASRWWDKSASRTVTLVGITCALWIVYTTSSSTPLFGTIMAIFGGLMFAYRYRMKLLRWSIVISLIVLHIIMKAPVWHLISRVSAVGGSTSYFRYALIDAFIVNVGEWWLIGVSSTAHWFWGAQDLTNQFVFEGVRGGMLTLILFVIAIIISFRSVGRIWRRVSDNKAHLALAWALGVSLFVHCVNFIGVSYFGQIILLWYMLLAIIVNIDIATEKNTLTKGTESS